MTILETSLIVGGLLMLPALLTLAVGLCVFIYETIRDFEWVQIVIFLFYAGIIVVMLGVVLATVDARNKPQDAGEQETETVQKIEQPVGVTVRKTTN